MLAKQAREARLEQERQEELEQVNHDINQEEEMDQLADSLASTKPDEIQKDKTVGYLTAANNVLGKLNAMENQPNQAKRVIKPKKAAIRANKSPKQDQQTKCA